MNRLPKKFEDEVLKEHNINYDDLEKGYYQYIDGKWFSVSAYEIASIALESTRMGIRYIGMKLGEDNKVLWGWHLHGNENEDFCTCIFKAIEEIYE